MNIYSGVWVYLLKRLNEQIGIFFVETEPEDLKAIKIEYYVNEITNGEGILWYHKVCCHLCYYQ